MQAPLPPVVQFVHICGAYGVRPCETVPVDASAAGHPAWCEFVTWLTDTLGPHASAYLGHDAGRVLAWAERGRLYRYTRRAA